MSFLSLCVCVVFPLPSDEPIASWLSFLTLVKKSGENFWLWQTSPLLIRLILTTVKMCLSRSYRAPLLILISTVQISQKAYSSPIFERWMNGHVREYSSRNFWVTFCFFAGGRDMMNTDRIKMCIIYVYNRSSPEIFKNPSTGLKLTKIRLDLVEKSRDQVKIEARMAHWVAT